MRKLKLFKGFALINFIGLVTLFLLYRNGSLDNLIIHQPINYFLSPNGGVEARNINDTTKVEFDSLNHPKITSSRPPAIIDKLVPEEITMNPNQDSASIKEKDDHGRLNRVMSSSKSGVIIEAKKFTISEKKKNRKRE